MFCYSIVAEWAFFLILSPVEIHRFGWCRMGCFLWRNWQMPLFPLSSSCLYYANIFYDAHRQKINAGMPVKCRLEFSFVYEISTKFIHFLQRASSTETCWAIWHHTFWTPGNSASIPTFPFKIPGGGGRGRKKTWLRRRSRVSAVSLRYNDIISAHAKLSGWQYPCIKIPTIFGITSKILKTLKYSRRNHSTVLIVTVSRTSRD